MFNRINKLNHSIQIQSQFLLGPRQTGKSTLSQALFPDAHYVDLLNRTTARELMRDPSALFRQVEFEVKKCERDYCIIIIDEIQTQPELLNEVQRILFYTDNRVRFILTGSSARKLRAQGVNLLGGRAGLLYMFPLVWGEISSNKKNKIQLDQCLNYGSLPSILSHKFPAELLKNYVAAYINLEIQQEKLTRSLPDFSRFLEVAALSNGQQISYRAIASDVGITEKTVAAWFQILSDTFLGELLPVFSGTLKRKTMTIPKFYFFDCGVCNAILERFFLGHGTPEKGIALENFIYTNLKAWCSFQSRSYSLSYWRTVDKKEVDFVISSHHQPLFAIEVKLSNKFSDKDILGLKAFQEEYSKCRCILLNMQNKKELKNGIEIIPVEMFLDDLWKDFQLVKI